MPTIHRRSASAVVALACLAIGVGCVNNAEEPIARVYDPMVVIRLVPRNASMPVGDTIAVVVQITGGNARTPPSFGSCASTVPSVAAAIRSAGACNVVGLSAGTAGIIVRASTGQVDSATVIVVAR